jgi:CRISPR-associated protein Cas2
MTPVLLSGYKLMWVFVMFDLPVDTRQARQDYAKFRKWLLADGFMKVQYSVYARVCSNWDSAQVHASRVGIHVPPDGEVRVFCMTDKQFARQWIYDGKRRQQPERPPKQLEFF